MDFLSALPSSFLFLKLFSHPLLSPALRIGKITFMEDYFTYEPPKSQDKSFLKHIAELPKRTKILICATVSVLLLLVICGVFALYVHSFSYVDDIPAATAQEQAYLNDYLNKTYPSKRNNILHPLPYPVVEAELPIHAGSAILIDAANGCVLYEKNADEAIPPASITKLFVMYIVFQEIAAGKVTLDDIVPLPENSWAINMPIDASLMFIGQGQTVTLRELLTGLAVASGNDAGYAIASYISGSVKAFVERMNEEVKKLGLEHTHFEEPSGYSENNITTARELAKFCRVYINNYPQSLSEFHSKLEINFPLEKNLPSWQKAKGDTMAVYQRNTNGLLRTLEGCDGLKTGFIYESGYNLALTAQRDGVRFISVTMRGGGSTSKEGKKWREDDGATLMEWAFSSFADYTPENHIEDSYGVAVTGAKGKFTRLVPAWKDVITVPHIFGATAQDDANAVTATVSIPKYIYGGVLAGGQYGKIVYKLGDVELETVPLVADRTLNQAGIWGRCWGTLASFFLD